jgi:hypothetical protein
VPKRVARSTTTTDGLSAAVARNRARIGLGKPSDL